MSTGDPGPGLGEGTLDAHPPAASASGRTASAVLSPATSTPPRCPWAPRQLDHRLALRRPGAGPVGAMGRRVTWTSCSIPSSAQWGSQPRPPLALRCSGTSVGPRPGSDPPLNTQGLHPRLGPAQTTAPPPAPPPTAPAPRAEPTHGSRAGGRGWTRGPHPVTPALWEGRGHAQPGGRTDSEAGGLRSPRGQGHPPGGASRGQGEAWSQCDAGTGALGIEGRRCDPGYHSPVPPGPPATPPVLPQPPGRDATSTRRRR